MAQPASTAASDILSPTHRPRSTGRSPGGSRVGRDGGGRRTSRQSLGGYIGSTHPTGLGSPQHAYRRHKRQRTRARVLRGSGRVIAEGPPRPRRLQPNLEREGCASAHAGVGRPRQGEGLIIGWLSCPFPLTLAVLWTPSFAPRFSLALSALPLSL
eukprot:6205122-Pleurochrysis_carterae.AAC.1